MAIFDLFSRVPRQKQVSVTPKTPIFGVSGLRKSSTSGQNPQKPLQNPPFWGQKRVQKRGILGHLYALFRASDLEKQAYIKK